MSQFPPAGQTPNYAGPQSQRPTSGLAIASLILGIVAIFPACCLSRFGVPLIVGIAAVVLGVMARGQVTRGEAGGGGMATAGIVCGAIGAVLGLVFLLIGIFAGPALQEKIRQIQRQTQQQQQQQQSAMPVSQELAQQASLWRIEMQ
ncbi:MAG: hypothetical protein JWN51_893 [Phycisphaerales bacterium]|nr:hypothetical protein [Phycisphaerales bacterium]